MPASLGATPLSPHACQPYSRSTTTRVLLTIVRQPHAETHAACWALAFAHIATAARPRGLQARAQLQRHTAPNSGSAAAASGRSTSPPLHRLTCSCGCCAPAPAAATCCSCPPPRAPAASPPGTPWPTSRTAAAPQCQRSRPGRVRKERGAAKTVLSHVYLGLWVCRPCLRGAPGSRVGSCRRRSWPQLHDSIYA